MPRESSYGKINPMPSRELMNRVQRDIDNYYILSGLLPLAYFLIEHYFVLLVVSCTIYGAILIPRCNNIYIRKERDKSKN